MRQCVVKIEIRYLKQSTFVRDVTFLVLHKICKIDQ